MNQFNVCIESKQPNVLQDFHPILKSKRLATMMNALFFCATKVRLHIVQGIVALNAAEPTADVLKHTKWILRKLTKVKGIL